MVGHVAAGKTTQARELSESLGAVRLTPDEWMAPLFRHPDPEGHRRVLEGRLIWTAAGILRAGSPVILDFGFWRRDERAALSWLARTVGGAARTVYLPVDRRTQSARVATRAQEDTDKAWTISQPQLDRWRELFQEPDDDELNGIYPSSPPGSDGWAGFITATWPTAMDG